MAAPRMGVTEWSMLILLSVLWGGAFLFSKVAVTELAPFTVVLGRVGLGALALLLVVHAMGQRMPTAGRAWGPFFVMGALNNVIPFSLIFWGQTHIASGLAAIINATTPLFAVILAHFLTGDERMTGNRLTGVLFGFAGVAAMIGPAALIDGFGLNILAQAAILGAALCYASAGIFGRRFRGMPPLVIAAGQVTASALMILPIALLVDHPWNNALPSPTIWMAVAGLALLSTTAAYILYFRILATAGATNVALVTFLIPISALLFGATLLHERIEPRQIAGMALIGLGLMVLDGRPLMALRRASAIRS